MTWRVGKGRSLPVGVDIGSAAVKLIQLRAGQNDLELVAAGSFELPPDQASDRRSRLRLVAQGIRNLLKTRPFRTRRCVFSLPAVETFVRHVKLPPVPEEHVPEALAEELRDKLPYPAENAIIRHVGVGEIRGDPERRQELIAVAAGRATVEAYLAMARQAKLDVIGVNVESCAIVECFQRLFRRASDRDRTVLFVDLGARSTQAVLARGGRIVFARNLPVGAEALDGAVAKGMDISLEEARSLRRDVLSGGRDGEAPNELYHFLDDQVQSMADELTQCVRYYESVFRENGVERAIFVGGGAYDKRLCQSLAQRLNLPAQIGDPLVRVKCDNGGALYPTMDRREPQPDWAVAVGLCLGAALN